MRTPAGNVIHRSPSDSPLEAGLVPICLVVAEHLLDGQPIDPIRGEDARRYGWEELHDAYAAKLAIPGTGWPDAQQ